MKTKPKTEEVPVTATQGIRYEVRTLGSPGGSFALSRHRLFRAACRACVAFIEQGLDAHVYCRRVDHRYAQTVGHRCVIFTNPEPDPDLGTDEVVTVLYRGRRSRP